METRFTILLIEIGIAMALQITALWTIMSAVRKSSERIEALAEDLHRRTVPILENAGSLLATSKPQIETVLVNLTETSINLKTQVDDIIDRTRLQVVRADELVSRTMDKVEETTELVHHSVISPVRQLAGVLHGLSMGMNVLFGKRGAAPRRHGNGAGAPQDEMFI